MGQGKRRDEEEDEEGSEERGHVDDCDWRQRRATWQSPGPWTLWRGIRD
jgi:hypothetical protein